MIRTPLTLFSAAATALAVLALAGCKNLPDKNEGADDAVAETDKDRDRRTAAEVAFYAECGKIAEAGGAISGKDDWLFESTELLRVSRIGTTGVATAAIADYAQQLRSRGIDLILVPVPPKAFVYPDKISRGTKVPMKDKRPVRLDSVIKGSMDSLSAKGVKVVDLLPVLIAHREDKAGITFPRTSGTWSPYGVQLAVTEIAAAVRASKAGGRGSVTGITSEMQTMNFVGSLALESAKAKPEVLAGSRIGRITDGKLRSLSFNTSGGSLLLMGGSDILAWREANNPQGSSGAFCSLAEQLAAELQMIPDVLANSGDGRNSPRLRILRERTNGRGMLGSTRAVVWVIPALDLTDINWQRVPLELQFSEGSPDIQLR
jgi:hypothetical protein